MVTLSLSVGVGLGLVAGFFRGVVESLIMRLMDILLALPSLLLAIVIVAILGPGLANAMIAVAIVYLPHYTRLTRASVIGELSKDYVTASRVSGAGLLPADVRDRAAQLHGAPDRPGDARLLERDSRCCSARLPGASAPSRRRRNGARCSRMRASSCCAPGGS